MHRGYLALWRRFQDHPFWQEKRVFSKAEAWIDLLWEAQHDPKPHQTIVKGKQITCYYGQTLKSYRTWATRWMWSEPSVRRFLKNLETLGQVKMESKGVTTQITILNYEQYDPKRRNPDAVFDAGNQLKSFSNEETMTQKVTTDNNEVISKKRIIAIPLKDGTEYEVPDSLVGVFEEAYPMVDVVAELSKVRAWNISNPDRRKTRRGIKKHLNTWMSNANSRVSETDSNPAFKILTRTDDD